MEITPGIDVSHYQGRFDFARAASEGNKFAFLKATEGVLNVDSEFKHSWSEAPRHGLLVGAYHFYHPSQDPGQQAAHFLNTMGPKRIGDLPAVLDWETSDHVRNSVQVQGVLAWLQMVEASTGKPPIIYASPGFLEAFDDLSLFKKYPLWIAHYGVNHPRIPKPWPTYTIWQYSDKGGVDKNVFNGSVARLRALAGVN